MVPSHPGLCMGFKEWAVRHGYDPNKEREQWEKIKTGARYAGSGMVGLAARSREYIVPDSINPLLFLLFLLIALAGHYLVEVLTVDIFTIERIIFHAAMAFVVCPLFLLGFRRFSERFEELFTVFIIALFLPAILMWISKGISWAGVDVHTTAFAYLTNIFFVPVWIYYAIFQEHVDPQWRGHSLKNFFGILIWLFWFAIILIGLVQHLQPLEGKFSYGVISEEYKAEAREKAKELPGLLKEFGKLFTNKVGELFEKPIRYAIGDDYYVGMVERGKEEKIGVYLENLRAASPQFFEDEPVSAWGILKARTLRPDQPIHVVTECVSVPLSPTPGLQNRVVGDANLEDPATLQHVADIANFEHIDLSCEYPAGLLGRGTRRITFNTTFDFSTDSYVKAYFIDQERLRTMVRQNINPLTQQGITETIPLATYTNGPIGIGMETSRTEHGTLIPVTPAHTFRFGITVENKWEGQIRSLRNVFFRLPVGTHVVPDACDFNLEEVPCSPTIPLCVVAEGAPQPSVVYKVGAASKRDMSGSVMKRGLDTVNRLFASDKRKFASFTCKVGFDNVEAVLGNVPLATQYFKATVDYEYVLEKFVTVTIKPVKEFLQPGVPFGQAGAGFGQAMPVEPYTVPKSDEEMLRKIWQTYQTDIAQASQDTGVPKGLIIALIAAESRGNPSLISPTGAAGLGQFTYKSNYFTTIRKCCEKEADEEKPYTCVNEHKRCGNSAQWCPAGGYLCSPDPNAPSYDDRFNAQHSIMAIADRLASDIKSYAKYAARIEFALASYNGGGWPVKTAIKQTGSDNPSWGEVSAQLSPSLLQSSGYKDWSWEKLQVKTKEIQNYVPKIMGLSEKAEAISEEGAGGIV